MKQFARVVNFQAVDVVPEKVNGYTLPERYHPSLIVEFREVPSTVRPGWYLWEGQWQAEQPDALKTDESAY